MVFSKARLWALLAVGILALAGCGGGDSDTDAKEFAVTPIGSPSGRRAVITVTPVAKVPKASRSSRGSIGLLTVVPGLARAQVCTGRRPSAHITRAGCGTRGAPSASR